MTEKIDQITNFHAHVYFDKGTKPVAEILRAELEAEFPTAKFGRWHDRPVGPHPEPSYQVAFGLEMLGSLVAFMALNRRGLSVFVHPETGHGLQDHGERAIWLGEVRPLKLSVFGKRRLV